MDALIKFSTEHCEKWSKHAGKKQVLDLANSEWNRINQSHEWVARIQHAVEEVVDAVHGVREQWNLLAAHELYTGTPLKVPDLVFMPGELERDNPEIWVKRLDQYMAPARTRRVNPPRIRTARRTTTAKVNHGMVEAAMGH